jgi:hypothetical protein
MGTASMRATPEVIASGEFKSISALRDVEAMPSAATT